MKTKEVQTGVSERRLQPNEARELVVPVTNRLHEVSEGEHEIMAVVSRLYPQIVTAFGLLQSVSSPSEVLQPTGNSYGTVLAGVAEATDAAQPEVEAIGSNYNLVGTDLVYARANNTASHTQRAWKGVDYVGIDTDAVAVNKQPGHNLDNQQQYVTMLESIPSKDFHELALAASGFGEVLKTDAEADAIIQAQQFADANQKLDTIYGLKVPA